METKIRSFGTLIVLSLVAVAVVISALLANGDSASAASGGNPNSGVPEVLDSLDALNTRLDEIEAGLQTRLDDMETSLLGRLDETDDNVDTNTSSLALLVENETGELSTQAADNRDDIFVQMLSDHQQSEWDLLINACVDVSSSAGMTFSPSLQAALGIEGKTGVKIFGNGAEVGVGAQAGVAVARLIGW